MNSSQNLHSKPLDRQDYDDLSIDEACQKNYDVFSPKFDGIWARVEIHDELCQVFSRTGQLKETFGVPAHLEGLNVETTCIGEFMYGSQWSKKNNREGKIYLFDMIELDFEPLWNSPYSKRYRQLMQVVQYLGPRFELVPVYKGIHLGGWWLKNEQERAYEGVVCRNWGDLWTSHPARIKLDVEDDFVIIGFEPGKGRLDGTLGALILGQYDETGTLVEVMTCGGGLSDELRDTVYRDKPRFFNRVITCTGKGRFDSGALRHPNFVRFHPDKPAHLCVLKSKSQ